jgi:hypothetical protein
VLLVGRPGSGKSTATLASMLGGLRYAGDDYVAIGFEPEPYVHSLYNSGKLDPDHVVQFPELLSVLSNPDKLKAEKAVIYVHDHFPRATTAGFPLRAIVMPRVTDRQTPRVVPAGRAAVLTALAPSTIIQLHTAGQDELRTMTRLVREVPTYMLELGAELPAIPGAISGLMSSLAA